MTLFALSVFYIQHRGKVRYNFWRQLSDHSTFLAPLNAFMYLFSGVPTTPYLAVENFPELALLRQNWQLIRDEGIQLMAQQKIKASDSYNDAGFNSFFRKSLYFG